MTPVACELTFEVIAATTVFSDVAQLRLVFALDVVVHAQSDSLLGGTRRAVAPQLDAGRDGNAAERRNVVVGRRNWRG